MGKCVSGEQGPYRGTAGFYVTTEYYHLLQCLMGNRGLLQFFTVKVFRSSQVTVEEENPYIFYEKHLWTSIHPSIHPFIHYSSLHSVYLSFYHSNKVKPPHYHRDGLRRFSTARSLTQESGTFEGTRDFLCTTQSFNLVLCLFITHFGKHWTDN